MSEVAGRIAVFSAGETLLKHNGGMGLLLSACRAWPRRGSACSAAGWSAPMRRGMAAGLGAEVVVVERSIPRMRELDDIFMGRVLTRYSTLDAVEDEILRADVVIGAVLTAGAAAPKLVRREHLARDAAGLGAGGRLHRPGRLFRDLAADHARRPDLRGRRGVVHYCVANMPGAAPRTSSEALGHATLPFGLHLADRGLDALKEDKHLAKGLNILDGQVTHPAVASALGMPFSDPYRAWIDD
ncbi:MAG: hypothetical protein WDM92_12055 [Caulobacteraceae bacterium]